MKILVTGGAGFIGSHVAEAYVKEGHDVVVIDNLSSGSVENLSPNVRFIEADVRDESLEKVFKEEKFDIVNHHAAQVSVQISVKDPLFDARLNILSTVFLLELSVKYEVKQFIFVSSGGAIYGEQEVFPAPETHKTFPVSPYGISKMSGEHYCRFYHETYGLKTVSLRYANVYGPRQSPHGEAGVVAIFSDNLLSGKTAYINGSGEQTRDYTFVGDIAHANVLAVRHELIGTYNIGTGKETTVNQIFDMVKKSSESPQERKHLEAKKGEQMRSVIDTMLLKNKTNWKPETDIKDGITKTVEFFKNKSRK
ncbi:MAG: GDP-mannose 4,6-dehydratase [Nitrospinae bacterium]|nr:GDP-mannose 4,6-dehydratase [Nitrospinota bacterium]